VDLAPLQLLPATVAGVLYALRAHALRRTPRAVPVWRQACFHGGVALGVVALVALGERAQERFAFHMLEHLLLGDLAALLVVLGLTGPVLQPVLRRAGALRTLAHPVVAVVLWAANLWLWHVPVLHEAAVREEAVHALQHALFVGLGANVWLALLGPLPKPAWFGNAARLVYIVAVRLIGAALGNVLVFGGRPFYPVYGTGPGDQNTAGAIMMIESSLLTLGLLCWLFLRAAREAEERQGLVELAQANGIALDERRAARAVAAGRGDELRRRLTRM
jgi:cytochrome c oxidase assembly factor CtaG